MFALNILNEQTQQYMSESAPTRPELISVMIKLYPKTRKHLREFALMTDQQLLDEFNRLNGSYKYLINDRIKRGPRQCIVVGSGLEAIKFNNNELYSIVEETKAHQYCIENDLPWNQ